MLARKMRQDKNHWKVEEVFHNTPVPLIRATYINGLKCDITFNSYVSVATTDIITHLFEIQPEARKFCIFIKEWLRINGFKIKNYTVVLLCVFYLQCEGHLPSIQKVNQADWKRTPFIVKDKNQGNSLLNFNTINHLTIIFVQSIQLQLQSRKHGCRLFDSSARRREFCRSRFGRSIL